MKKSNILVAEKAGSSKSFPSVSLMPIVLNHLKSVEPLDNDLRRVVRWLDDNASLWDGKRVLVVGCLEEPISNALGLLGCDVVGVDVRAYGCGDFDSGSDKPFYEHLVGDFNSESVDISGSFDLVLAISSVEHFGLGYYKSPVDPEADVKAVARMASLLSPKGRIVITVPFSQKPQVTNHWRSYDNQGIRKLAGLGEGYLEEFETDYFFTGYRSIGREMVATDEEVKNHDGGADLSVMLVLGKKGTDA